MSDGGRRLAAAWLFLPGLLLGSALLLSTPGSSNSPTSTQPSATSPELDPTPSPAPQVLGPQVLGVEVAEALPGLLADVGIGRPHGSEGWRVGDVLIERDRVSIALWDAGGTPHGSVWLLPRSEAAAGAPLSRSFAVSTPGPLPPAGAALVTDLVASVQRHDVGGLYRDARRAAPPPPTPTPAPSTPPSLPAPQRTARTLGWLLLLGSAAGALFTRRRAVPWDPHARANHLIPATLQLLILSYWGLHWAPLRGEMPWIAALLVAALVLDSAVGLARSGRLRVGPAVVPVVFSTHLYMLQRDGHRWLGWLAIGAAVLSRHLLVRGEGGRRRHVFNPSALGILLVGALVEGTGLLPTGDETLRFAAAPNMSELILLLALVVQLRLPVAVLSLGGALGLALAQRVFPHPVYGPGWAPVTLVLALLITDPGTTPRSQRGKLLFGFLWGLLAVAAGNLLLAAGRTDFFGKLAPLLLLQPLMPRLERAATRLPGWLERPRARRAALALWWLGMGLWFLPAAKRGAFESDPDTPRVLLTPGSEGRADCALNPVYCRPFSFAGELYLWRERARRARRRSPPAESPRSGQ